MIELHWTQAVFLYLLAFIGVWHIIGIPPVIKWFKRERNT